MDNIADIPTDELFEDLAQARSNMRFCKGIVNSGMISHCNNSRVDDWWIENDQVAKSILQELKQGIKLADGMAKFESIRCIGGAGENQWYSVVVTEGRNRLVRRLWQAKKIAINRLIRVRFCAIILPSLLNLGRFIELGVKEVNMLKKLAKHVYKM